MTPDAAPESRNQLITALVIALVMGVIAVSALWIGWKAGQLPLTVSIVAGIAGALANALNAPSGISKVISAAKQPTQNPTTNPTSPQQGAS